jgi:hypothetical protein
MPVTAAKPALPKSQDKPGLAAAKPASHKVAVEQVTKSQKKTVDKPAAAATAPVTKPVRLAKTDPLAPLPATHSTKPRASNADR